MLLMSSLKEYRSERKGRGLLQSLLNNLSKIAAILFSGYVGLIIGNSIASTAALAFPTGSIVLLVIGPVMCGTIVGILTNVLLGCRYTLLCLFISWMPILFSWLMRGARIYTTSITINGDEGLPSSVTPRFHIDYAGLLMMLILSGMASVISYMVLCRVSKHEK